MITTYDCRIQFVGKQTNFIETKEFSFATALERQAFIGNLSALNATTPSNAQFKLLAQWEGGIHQDWRKAETELLQAYMAPAR